MEELNPGQAFQRWATMQDLDATRAAIPQAIQQALLGNYVAITNGSTVNGQGAGGPTIIALVSLKAKASGLFRWSASAVQGAAAAGETVDFIVTSQTGSVPETFTGGTTAVGTQNTNNGSSDDNLLTSNGIAGTGIVITAGGGSELIQDSVPMVVGTAATGAAFSSGGIMQNSVSSLGVRVPFTRGNNVMLILKITSTTNRQVTGICLSLEELPF